MRTRGPTFTAVVWLLGKGGYQKALRGDCALRLALICRNVLPTSEVGSHFHLRACFSSDAAIKGEDSLRTG